MDLIKAMILKAIGCHEPVYTNYVTAQFKLYTHVSVVLKGIIGYLDYEMVIVLFF